MPDTVLTLGDFAFSGTEVPEDMPFGGEQSVVVHVLPGGKRVVDAMGADDAPLEWSGRFRGGTALERARYLDGLRKAGTVLTLSWFDLSYSVVIKSFKATVERFYEVRYSISCEVVEDETAPVTEIAEPDLNDALDDDLAWALDLGGQVGDSGLLGLIAGIGDALDAVDDLLTAGQSVLNSVLDPIWAAQSAALVLVADAESLIGSVSTIGGVDIGGWDQGPVVLAQTVASDNLASLYQLGAVLGRMERNVTLVGSSGETVPVAGAVLQRVAADRFGDASEWTGIARASGLSDPVVSGEADLRVPARRDGAGGVLRHG